MEDTTDSKYQGLPKAIFIDDMDTYLKKNKFANSLEASHALDGHYQRFTLIRHNVEQRRVKLINQLPNLNESLEAITRLREKSKDFDATFSAADQVFMEANIPDANTVYLWIGSNVMLAYDLDGAEKILKENRDLANSRLAEDAIILDFIKEQMTTIEVNLARLHNYTVKLKQEHKIN